MILFVFNDGIGNIVQQIPVYLALREKYEVDVAYLKQYAQDSIENVSIVPCDDIAEIIPSELDDLMSQYEYTYVPPFLTKNVDGELTYVKEVQDDFYELDSEVNRYLKVLKHFDLPCEVKRDIRYNESHHTGDIVVHNGSKKGWERKLYPYMQQVTEALLEKGYDVTCIGAPDEYCGGKNATGTSLRTTVGTIKNHKVYLGTDTGTYHIAAMLEKPGVCIFTATDPWKNYDVEFHKSISLAMTLLPCQPCQRGYHYSPDWANCQEHLCQGVNPNQIIRMVEGKMH